MKPDRILPKLEDEAERLARELLPMGRKIGREWDCRADDSPIGSVSVVLSGRKKGRVGFWQGRPDRPAQNGGDLLHLIMAIKGLDFPDAMRWACEFLGEEPEARETPEEKAARLAALEAKRQERARQEATAAERKQERARRMWQTASPRLRGTVVESYLQKRGIALAAIPHPEAWLRYQARLEWWMGATRTEIRPGFVDRRPGPSFPALVAAIVDARGVQTAVHCTYLAPDGSGKAPVEPAKLMFGSVEGCVIRLTKGASGLTPEEARAAGVAGLLVLAEGIENGLSVAIADPEPRVWAATSLSNLARAPVWHPCVEAVIVARDNDRGNDQAELAFERALEELRSHGKPVAVMQVPARVKDVNDLVKG